MKVALIQLAPWDKIHFVDPGDLVFKSGDRLVVKTSFGEDLAKVLSVENLTQDAINADEEKLNVERLAIKEDLEIAASQNESKKATISHCRAEIKKQSLKMKLVDGFVSLDGKRLTFAFVADGRVDFRALVKDLTRHFQKNIRLYQLGVRDEAKNDGDVGTCGLNLCCKGSLKKLGSITSEYAEQQQVAHRGSERLSGICGRLKCCLAYEKELYDELAQKLPAVGTKVSTKFGRGEVIGWHTLRCSVDVRINPEKEGERPIVVEIPIIK